MIEKEYIEREKLNDMLEDFCVNESFYDALQTIPAADVVPVRHGRWIYNPNGMDFNLGAWECSVCTQKNNNLPCIRNINPYICVGSKYCPNCGAKMDKTE